MLKGRVATISGCLIIALFLFKYVLSQANLIKTDLPRLWLVISTLLFVSFVLGAFETAISRITDDELFLWQSGIAPRWEKVREKLSDPTFDSLSWLRLAARALHKLQELRVAPFIDYEKNTRDDGVITYVPLPNVEQALSFCLTVGIVIDVNVTVLFTQVLTQTNSFQNLAWPKLALFDRVLPYPGSAGFTAVGVSLLILLLVEVLPKKVAIRDKLGVLRWGSWLVAALYCLCIPAMVAKGVETLAELTIENSRHVKKFYFWLRRLIPAS